MRGEAALWPPPAYPATLKEGGVAALAVASAGREEELKSGGGDGLKPAARGGVGAAPAVQLDEGRRSFAAGDGPPPSLFEEGGGAAADAASEGATG